MHYWLRDAHGGVSSAVSPAEDMQMLAGESSTCACSNGKGQKPAGETVGLLQTFRCSLKKACFLKWICCFIKLPLCHCHCAQCLFLEYVYAGTQGCF